LSKNTDSVVALIAAGSLLAFGLTACAPTPQSPEDRARDIADRWVSASVAGNEEAAYALTCPGAPPGGVGGDTPDYESHTLDVEDVGDGDFNIKIMVSYTDYPDLISKLRVQTDGSPCIKWVR
jgi:hypothetical protein